MRRPALIVGDAVLVLLLLAFAYANFLSWRQTGRPSGLGTTALETLTAGVFLTRRRTTYVSRSWAAWAAAPIGSFAMLFARPAAGGAVAVGEPLQLLGLALAVVSLGVLGRSFGVVAANRGVKTRGPYRIVRHPAYAGYLVAYSGYVVENPSPRNVLLLIVGTAFQIGRIVYEERTLSLDARYRRYCEHVRFRLLPFVY
jgi:protein-S-isoprenylcysteine O-methyltransferase Ste14